MPSPHQGLAPVATVLAGNERLRSGVCGEKEITWEVRGYCDASYRQCKMSAKSITGWVTTVGGTALSWKSHKQSTVAQSTAEAKYIAACSVSKECVYLRQLLSELGYLVHITVYCDSTAAIAMIFNPVRRQMTGHFLVAYHYVRECNKKNDSATNS